MIGPRALCSLFCTSNACILALGAGVLSTSSCVLCGNVLLWVLTCVGPLQDPGVRGPSSCVGFNSSDCILALGAGVLLASNCVLCGDVLLWVLPCVGPPQGSGVLGPSSCVGFSVFTSNDCILALGAGVLSASNCVLCGDVLLWVPTCIGPPQGPGLLGPSSCVGFSVFTSNGCILALGAGVLPVSNCVLCGDVIPCILTCVGLLQGPGVLVPISAGVLAFSLMYCWIFG